MRSSILGHPGERFSQQPAFHPRFARFRGYCEQKAEPEGLGDIKEKVGAGSLPPHGSIRPVDRKQAKSFWMKKE
jgi:hypothetical protein